MINIALILGFGNQKFCALMILFSTPCSDILFWNLTENPKTHLE
jgi:hypothetical protein